LYKNTKEMLKNKKKINGETNITRNMSKILFSSIFLNIRHPSYKVAK